MRQLYREQPTLVGRMVDDVHPRELEGVHRILRGNPRITALVLQPLKERLRVPEEDGREGMTAEQVLRVAVLKQARRFSYS